MNTNQRLLPQRMADKNVEFITSTLTLNTYTKPGSCSLHIALKIFCNLFKAGNATPLTNATHTHTHKQLAREKTTNYSLIIQ